MTARMPVPPTLPISRPPTPWRPVRVVIVGVAQAFVLLVLGSWFDGITVTGWGAALFAVGVLAVIGAVVWPLAIRFTLPIITLTLGLFTFVLNGLAVLAVDAIVDGFSVSSFWLALLLALALTVVNISVGGLLNIDDDHVWREHVVRRLVSRREPPEATDVPGVLFIQVDGLGYDVLHDAMASGHAPTLTSLVEHGTHHLVPWECDLSSQTGAMQAGILLGDNRNMPAFRWYEKDTGRIMVSNRPNDAADIEQRQSTGTGLLARGGASTSNVFSGDAPDAMLTFSRVTDPSAGRSRIAYVVATPYALFRVVVLSLVEVVRELRDARRARRASVEPSMHRGGSYPLLRAATTVALAEMTQALLMADILRGVPSAYVDLVGYDEVAHHSGIAATESLATLQRTDDRLRRVLTTLDSAPRPYYVVVLSDHGQTQGSTFLQRYGQTLEDVIGSFDSDATVDAPALPEEGWHNVNGMLTDVVSDDSSLGRTAAWATRNRTVDGEVRLGPTEDTTREEDDIIVLASGNLGLVSFPSLPGRATREEIERSFPGLVDGLAGHEGVGFVMVRAADGSDVVFGGDGAHDLTTGTVKGVDPLEPFGPNAAAHLRRTGSFDNCPDLIVNSFYDPVTDEGAAFEELIGFHGGLGGKQTRPFVLAPAGLTLPAEPLVGATSLHHLFTSWLSEVGQQ